MVFGFLDWKLDAIDLPDDLLHPLGVEWRGIGFPGLGSLRGGLALDLTLTADRDLAGTLQALRREGDPQGGLDDAGQRLIVDLEILEPGGEVEHRRPHHLGGEAAELPNGLRAQPIGPGLEGLPGLEHLLAGRPRALIVAVDSRQADTLSQAQLVEQSVGPLRRLGLRDGGIAQPAVERLADFVWKPIDTVGL